jgi:hypothetical protein
MSSLASIVKENLQGFLEIFIPSVKCLRNRPTDQVPKVEQEANQKLTRVEGSLVEFAQILKSETKHQNEVVKHEQTTYQQTKGVTIKQIVYQQTECVNVEQIANQQQRKGKSMLKDKEQVLRL